MKAGAIGVQLKVEFHLLPEPGETLAQLVIRATKAGYNILSIDEPGARILVARSD